MTAALPSRFSVPRTASAESASRRMENGLPAAIRNYCPSRQPSSRSFPPMAAPRECFCPPHRRSKIALVARSEKCSVPFDPPRRHQRLGTTANRRPAAPRNGLHLRPHLRFRLVARRQTAAASQGRGNQRRPADQQFSLIQKVILGIRENFCR